MKRLPHDETHREAHYGGNFGASIQDSRTIPTRQEFWLVKSRAGRGRLQAFVRASEEVLMDVVTTPAELTLPEAERLVKLYGVLAEVCSGAFLLSTVGLPGATRTQPTAVSCL